MHLLVTSLLVGSAALILISTPANAATTSVSIHYRYTVNDDQTDGWRPLSVNGIDFSGMTLQITGSGSVCAGNCGSAASWYGADGNPPDKVAGLDALALVGKWGSSKVFSSSYGSVFQIGASLTIDAPDAQPAYLYLGVNDDYFEDNAGSFSASITYGPTPPASPVPIPAGSVLLVSALAAGAAATRRRKT